MSSIESAKPYAEHEASLKAAISEREAKRDRKVRELQNQIGEAQRASTKDVHRIEAAAVAETEALATALAKDEWAKLTPLIGRILEHNFSKRSDLEELSAIWHELEARSTRLLPPHVRQPQIIASHRLLYAVAYVCQVTTGIEPDCDAFLRTGIDGFDAQYVPGWQIPHRSVMREAELIKVLQSAQPIAIGDVLKGFCNMCDAIITSSPEAPTHWRKRERWELIRFGGTVEGTTQKLRALKELEDVEPKRIGKELSDAHVELMDQRRRGILNLPTLEQIMAATKRAVGIDPYAGQVAPAPEAAE